MAAPGPDRHQERRGHRDVQRHGQSPRRHRAEDLRGRRHAGPFGTANTIGGTIGVESPGVLVGGTNNTVATSAALGGSTTQVVLNGGRMKLTPLGAGVDIVNATPALAGSALQSGGTWTVTGSGNDIWNLADSFHYLSAQMTGDFSVSADLTAMVPSTNTWTKAGIMARETLAAGSKFFMLVDTNGAAGGAGHEIAAQWRDTNDAACGSFYGATSPSNNGHQLRIKLERSAGIFQAFTAPLTDPDNWSPFILDAANGTTHADTMTASTIYVGLAVTSHEAAQTASATFNNLQGFAPSTQTTNYGNDVRVAAYGSIIEAGSDRGTRQARHGPQRVLEIASGTIVFKGQTTLGDFSAFRTSGGDLVLAGNVTGAAGSSLTKDGAGTLTIAGAPQYPGDTTITEGKLIYQVATGSSPTVAALEVADQPRRNRGSQGNGRSVHRRHNAHAARRRGELRRLPRHGRRQDGRFDHRYRQHDGGRWSQPANRLDRSGHAEHRRGQFGDDRRERAVRRPGIGHAGRARAGHLGADRRRVPVLAGVPPPQPLTPIVPWPPPRRTWRTHSSPTRKRGMGVGIAAFLTARVEMPTACLL